jgi:hypothetical protein
MENKDMKVNLNKEAIEGLFLEQGSSFLLDVHVDFDKKQHEMLQPSKCDITVAEILRAAGGIGATMKLARRRLNAVGGKG